MSATQESVPDRLDEDAPRPAAKPAVRRFQGPLVLLLAGVLLAALGGWFLSQSLADASSGNHALVDKAATNRLIGDVSDGLSRIFSYSYTDTEATQQAADAVLTGKAAGQYRTLFGQVRQNAVTQKLKLTTRVVSAGVTSLDGSHAQLLVFLDQTSTRADTGQTSAAAAQLSISAQLFRGHWLITDIHAR
ncbi:MAG TPA: hypothetical protein VHV49_05455 [Pseudonocardiaceae bacterium]|nr:hypothetical protein [Pseudonocardiaceae bacterium]